MLKFVIILVAACAFAYYAYLNFYDAFVDTPDAPRACTMEAKLCPDGSAVGRSGPNCEFALCPSER